jgi:ComF family protein
MDIEGGLCGPCLEQPPKHDGVLAAVEYGDVARALALKLKYGRKPGVAAVMASAMMRHASMHPDALLIPVPLHRWRIWQRGFNQSLLIARYIADRSGQDVVPEAIVRIKQTSPLGGLSRNARAKEVGGAFRCEGGNPQRVKGRNVLLVDDVYTTGATTNACAAVLKRAGAKTVRVLAWARVLKD